MYKHSFVKLKILVQGVFLTETGIALGRVNLPNELAPEYL